MTTIVYDHKARQIAVDGRYCRHDIIVTDKAEKWVERDGDYWFFAGTVADQERFIEQFLSDNPQRMSIDCCALMVRDGDAFHCVVGEDGKPMAAKLTYSDSMGSGQEFAIAALDHGKTAKMAVEYAMTRDCATGGKVSVFDVEKMEFIE
jgi:hypothetical protein